MAEKQVNYYAEEHSGTNLSCLSDIEYAKNVINTQAGAVFEKCKIVADYYGHEPQSRMLQEEAAELIQAVNKYYRSTNAVGLKSGEASDNLVEEMADVIIMIIQELMLQGTDIELFAELLNLKLDRQIKRMEGEK